MGAPPLASGEFARIARLAQRFGKQQARGVVVGIGDDAAVLEPEAGAKLVWTIDEQVETTHFRREFLSWGDLGWRSFMAAASDLAAMGATPWCALSAIVLPADLDDVAFDALVRGQEDAALAAEAPIIGGNLARGPLVSVTTTLLGSCGSAIERGGAAAGDGLWICGPLGLAAAGLVALQRGVTDARVDPAISVWRRPVAQLAAGRSLVAHAAIDVSDGLTQDLAHLADASGLRAVLDEHALLAHGGAELHEAAAALSLEALDCLLYGGEDYALLAASDVAIPGFSRIGTLSAGKGISLARGGVERVIVPRGFDHFRP